MNVLLVNIEDGLEDTVRPRCDAAGAAISRLNALTSVPNTRGGNNPFSIPRDLPFLENVIRGEGVRLILIDPLTAFLGGHVDSYKDHDVRLALAPLAQLAEQTGAASVIVRHFTKTARGNAISAGAGSIGIAGIARSCLQVAPDPKDSTLRVLAQAKSNLGGLAPSLAFRVAAAEGAAAHIEWLGTSTATAEDLNNARREVEGAPELREAEKWLECTLLEAGGHEEKRTLVALAKDAGIAQRTLHRAARALGLKQTSTGFGAEKRATWSLQAASGEPSPFVPIVPIVSYTDAVGTNGTDGTNGKRVGNTTDS
jgi:hypothetical protein